MTDARTPTYDQLSALCAQMAAALEECNKEAVMSNNIIRMGWPSHGQGRVKIGTSLHRVEKQSEKALTAYRNLSPDPHWQRVPEGAATDVLAERRRQIEREGWTPEHDDEHSTGEIAKAAACYAWAGSASLPISRERIANALWDRFGSDDGNPVKRMWPWDAKWWKPKNRRHDLVRAGALIIAEIERLDRARGEG